MKHNERLARYIDQAVNATFEQMLAMSARNHRTQADSAVTALENVSGVVELVNPTFRGILAVTFPESTIKAIMASFYDGEATAAQIDDGAGEIVNAIFGQLKTRLNGEGHELKAALPRKLRGEGFRLVGSPLHALKLEFSTPHGKFRVCFSFNAVVERGTRAA